MSKPFGSQSVSGEVAAAMGIDPRPFMTSEEIQRQLEITGMTREQWDAAWEQKLAEAKKAPF